MRHMPRRSSLSPSFPSFSFSLWCVCIANANATMCRKVSSLRSYHILVWAICHCVYPALSASPSLPLPLSLSFPSSLSLSPPLCLSLSLSLKHFSGIPSSRCSLLLHLNCATCYLSFSFSPSLCLTHTHSLAVQLLLLEFNSECSTRSALAQRAERKTLDTNLNSRARRSRSDACKLLQARAVTSLSSTTSRPLTSPPTPPCTCSLRHFRRQCEQTCKLHGKFNLWMKMQFIIRAWRVCVWVWVQVCECMEVGVCVCLCMEVCVCVCVCGCALIATLDELELFSVACANYFIKQFLIIFNNYSLCHSVCVFRGVCVCVCVSICNLAISWQIVVSF